jgi:four helix bundle suffix protein
VVANIAICLINQTNYLLDRQKLTLEKEFINTGGIRERMTQARLLQRAKNDRSPFGETPQ